MQSKAVDVIEKDCIKKTKESLTEDESLRLLAEIIANNIIQKLSSNEESEFTSEQFDATDGKEREAA